MGVEDPSAYGLVRLNGDRSVKGFLEKPKPEEIDTKLVNAGIYILHHDVLEGMAPAGTNSSIERDLFPTLVGNGLYGYEASGYWMDIGTPGRYLQATREILDRQVKTIIGDRVHESGGTLIAAGRVEGTVLAPSLIDAGAEIAAGASVGPHAVLGRGVRVGEGSHVEASVLFDGAVIGSGAVVRNSVIGRGVEVGRNCVIEDEVILGDGVKLGADNVIRAGARIFPGVELPAGAIKI